MNNLNNSRTFAPRLLAAALIAVLILIPGPLGAQSVYTPYTFTTLAGTASIGSDDGTG
jgi:hypothetical protein